MRRVVLTLFVSGCFSEGAFKVMDEDIAPQDPAKGSPDTDLPTSGTSSGSSSGTSSTGTSSGTDTTSTTTVPSTYPQVVEIPPAPPEPCPYAADAVAVADCASGGYAALVAGVGYPDIQSAIDASGPGETITVCPGTWPGGLLLGGGRTLTAADPTPGATVIDGASSMRGITSDNATLIGLTVTNGLATEGGGVLDNGSLVLECMVFNGNQAYELYYGGGYYGAYPIGDGGAVYASDVIVRYSAFSENWAGYSGGAIYAGQAVVEDSVFTSNFAGYEGGALAIPYLEVRRSELVGNTAEYESGAIDAGGAFTPGYLLLEDTLFDSNTADYAGGAITIGSWETDPTMIARSLFVGNSSPYGSAVISLGTWGGVDLVISESTFRGNIGSAAIGADGWIQQGGLITLDYSIFVDNQGTQAGFLSTNATDQVAINVVATDLIVHRNSGGAGAVELRVGDTLDCTNCDFGAGADDNTPRDAQKAGNNYSNLGLTFTL